VDAGAVVMAPAELGLPLPFTLTAGWGTTPLSFGRERESA